MSEETMTRGQAPRAMACAAQWRKRGVDLAAFNTEESAHDVAAVARALGAKKIALLGFSYGTHLGLAVLRQHPDLVERAVLAGVEAPEATWKFPSTYDAQLEALSAVAGIDLVAHARTAARLVAERPLEITVTAGARGRTIQMGLAGLRYLLRRDLGDTNDWAWLPAAIVEVSRGDTRLLARVVARRLQQIENAMSLMPVAMDCGSAASADRLARIKGEEAASLLGAMTNFPYPLVCQALDIPALPDSFRSPVTSDVPTLFVSGSFDANTPAAQAAAVAAGFSRATELLVENAGHESTLPAAAVQRVIVGFLDGRPVETRRLVLEKPVVGK